MTEEQCILYFEDPQYIEKTLKEYIETQQNESITDKYNILLGICDILANIYSLTIKKK